MNRSIQRSVLNKETGKLLESYLMYFSQKLKCVYVFVWLRKKGVYPHTAQSSLTLVLFNAGNAGFSRTN